MNRLLDLTVTLMNMVRSSDKRTCICIYLFFCNCNKNQICNLSVLHVHVYNVPTLLTKPLYPLQDGNTPLHYAAKGGHTTCVEHLLSTPGIDVNIKDKVNCSTEY